MTYDPTVGRFITLDPIGFEGTDKNTYRYVGNGPTNLTDPSGFRETDDRWTTWTKNLVDVTSKVEDKINLWVSDCWDTEKSLFENTHQYSARQYGTIVCRNICKILGDNQPGSEVFGVFAPISTIGVWLDRDLSTKDHEIVKLKFSQTRYHNNELTSSGELPSPFPWLACETTANHGIAPVIRIGGTPGTTNGTLVGTDKFEHFFQQGYWLFDLVYGDARTILLKKDPKMPNFSDVAIRRAFSEWMEGISSDDDPLIAKYRRQFEEVGRHFRVPLGEGGYGTASTGIASWADIRAGLDGFLFYESVYKAFASDPSANAYRFSLGDYDVSRWNEQTNPNWFVPGLKTDDTFDPGVPPPPSKKPDPLLKPPWWAPRIDRPFMP